jgi:hypothetical protein
LNDVKGLTIFFKSGGEASYGTIKSDPLFSVLIEDERITMRWLSGSHAIFNMADIAGYYIDKKGK